MANVIVVSETPQRVIIRDEAATRTVKVVAMGPQGPSGNVNPLMFQMLDEAQAAAADAASSATTAVTSADFAAISASSAQGSATVAASFEASTAASSVAATAAAAQADTSAAAALTSEVGAQASATSATASAASAQSSAQSVIDKANIADAAADSASASAATATTKASDASTSAASAATSAVAASGSASTATTKASEASTSASNSATSALLAQSWAIKTDAPVSAGEYSAKYHAQAASASATAASGSATAASNSATSASNSASAASTSATNSATSAAQALQAKNDAVAALASKLDAAATQFGGNAATASKLLTARTISVTGDLTWSTSFDGSGNVTAAGTLANSGVTAGTYGSATQVRPFTVDAKGRLTSVGAAVTITPAWGSITGKPTTLTGYGITDALQLGSTAGSALGVAAAGAATTAARSDHVHPLQTTVSGNAGTATKLATARTISTTGDATWSVSFDGSAAATAALTLANSGVTAGTYRSVTTDAKGRITGGTNPTTLAGYGITDAVASSTRGVANGVATLDASGLVPSTQLPSYVDDVLEFANLAGFPATGETGKIYVALDTNKTYRWSGTAYVYITSGAVDSVAGKTGAVVLVKADVGLGSVDNTADVDKPVSTATQTALNLKSNLASPTFTGAPKAPTAAAGTNTTQLATTEFATAAANAVKNGRLLAVNVFTRSNNGQTYTPTEGTSFVIVEAVGGGGGGGGTYATSANQHNYGTGGDCGKYGKGYYTSGFSGVTLTIGAGGSGVLGNSGTAGGQTSFGGLLVCPGGGGGGMINTLAANAQFTLYGTPVVNAAITGANIMSHHGFKGSDGRSNGAFNFSSGGGNSSYLGAGGPEMNLNNNGAPALGYGGGGSGAASDQNNGQRPGGAGGNGLIVVYEYA